MTTIQQALPYEGQEQAMEHPLTDVIPPLKATDRCCRCGAQAYFAFLLTINNDAPVLLCGHHLRAHKDAILASKPFAIRDEIMVLHQQERAKATSDHTS